MNRLLWLNFFEEKTMPNWKEGSSIYFRHTPYIFDWVVLLMMNLLNLINILYVDQEKTQKLEVRCYEFIRERYQAHFY